MTTISSPISPEQALSRAGEMLDRGRLDDALAAAQQSRELALDASDEIAVARAATMVGTIMAYQTRYEDSMQWLLPNIPIVEGTEYRHELGRSYSVLGFALGVLGDPERGLEWASKALALAERQGVPRALVRAHINRAVLIDQMGDWQRAEQSLLTGLEQARIHGFHVSECAALLNLGEVHMHQAHGLREDGDEMASIRHARAAGDWYQRAIVASRLHDYETTLADALVKAAKAHVLEGRMAEVPALLAQVAPLATRKLELQVEMQLTRGMAAVEAGREQEARQALEVALQGAQECNQPDLLHAVLYELCRLERLYGHLQDALRHFEARHRSMIEQYKRRLRMVARSAELWAEAEQARQQARHAIQREAELLKNQAELLARAEQLRQDAMRDGLTEILNRRGMEAAARALLQQDGPLALALIDADHFKQVNDVFGHATGDAVLKQLARLLEQDTRSSDILARLGGEEFVLLLPGTTANEASSLCERVRRRVEAHDWTALAPGLQVRISLGLHHRQGSEDLDKLLALADRALYEAKAAGRNCVRCSSV
ncbi:diguanylate cyclase [Paucibacter sp. APW11]|uniref:diguanylate cyclase n=1 Tax=Roseateles aquae TaxID=3077235 RepID=A0ABU3PCF2_9BURK|nr:diguanylate cyclase [Paucibacter sp. APW11]MDT9000249.1 diguanylate cyclase [Paucibacter sp. APW11]